MFDSLGQTDNSPHIDVLVKLIFQPSQGKRRHFQTSVFSSFSFSMSSPQAIHCYYEKISIINVILPFITIRNNIFLLICEVNPYVNSY